MQAPTNLKQLGSFLGLVMFYWDMWPKQSHILGPLTDLLGTNRFTWGKAQLNAFKKKRI